MINLMYLVLTALLALNVSAEVMNAFFSLDKGMKSSMDIVQTSNEAIIGGIDKQVEAYPKEENKMWQGRAKEAVQVAASFHEYIDGIRNQLTEKAGGEDPKIPGQPKDIRNKDITTNMFINEGLGAQIEEKIRETRKKLADLVENDEATVKSFPLDIEEIPDGVKSANWAEYKFKQMPVAAIFPILGKMQSDAKNSATAVLNHCATKVGGVDIKFDEFEPVISASKGYVISGETYEADVFLSARSSTADNISISVNGSSLPVAEGKAKYTTRTSGVGTRKYNVNISVKNPLDGTVTNYPKEFEYEVGQRSVAVALDKMNVFYIGVDNPISVSAAGVSSNEVRVSGNGVTVASQGGGKFNVTATKPGDATLTVSGGGVSQTFQYRVKRIPDPVPKLGAKHLSSLMGNGEFKAQGGIAAILENFDFEARCDVVGFVTTYLAKRQDPSPPTPNAGARFGGSTADYVSRAKPGDAYFFDDIKVKCPGDNLPRNLGGLTFRIK
jgi:gliding motility-associated protein GldM